MWVTPSASGRASAARTPSSRASARRGPDRATARRPSRAVPGAPARSPARPCRWVEPYATRTQQGGAGAPPGRVIERSVGVGIETPALWRGGRAREALSFRSDVRYPAGLSLRSQSRAYGFVPGLRCDLVRLGAPASGPCPKPTSRRPRLEEIAGSLARALAIARVFLDRFLVIPAAAACHPGSPRCRRRGRRHLLAKTIHAGTPANGELIDLGGFTLDPRAHHPSLNLLMCVRPTTIGRPYYHCIPFAQHAFEQITKCLHYRQFYLLPSLAAMIEASLSCPPRRLRAHDGRTMAAGSPPEPGAPQGKLLENGRNGGPGTFCLIPGRPAAAPLGTQNARLGATDDVRARRRWSVAPLEPRPPRTLPPTRGLQ